MVEPAIWLCLQLSAVWAAWCWHFFFNLFYASDVKFIILLCKR